MQDKLTFKQKDIVEKIVATYELPSKLEKKVCKYVKKRIRYFGLVSFSDQYREITETIELFTQKSYEKSAKSLDQEIFCNSGKTYHNYLADKNKSPEDLIINENNEQISIQKLLESVKKSEINIEILEHLIKNNQEILIDFPRENVTERINWINEKLKIIKEEIPSKYVRNGKIVLPARSIKNISFNPFKIEFLKREYENPSKFFRDNIEIYGNLSAEELYHFDLGLYCKLLKEGKLNQTIKKIKKGLSERKIEQILEIYEEENGNHISTAKILGCNKDTVLKYVEAENVRLKANNYPEYALSVKETARLLSYLRKNKNNGAKTHKKLGFWKTLIYKYRDAAGIEKYKKEQLFPEEKDLILSLYEKSGRNTSKASRLTERKYSRDTIRKVWKESNKKTKNGRKGFEFAEIEKIINIYFSTKNINEASQRSEYNYHTIRKYGLAIKVETLLEEIKVDEINQDINQERLSYLEIAEVIGAHRSCKRNSKKAAKRCDQPKEIVEKYWKLAKLNFTTNL